MTQEIVICAASHINIVGLCLRN